MLVVDITVSVIVSRPSWNRQKTVQIHSSNRIPPENFQTSQKGVKWQTALTYLLELVKDTFDTRPLCILKWIF